MRLRFSPLVISLYVRIRITPTLLQILTISYYFTNSYPKGKENKTKKNNYKLSKLFIFNHKNKNPRLRGGDFSPIFFSALSRLLQLTANNNMLYSAYEDLSEIVSPVSPGTQVR
ncbi:hypothetical protein [Aneurinibacillus thermoaerophilus]|uniref:hypothetical protein n=1 Tax=Aneurinibacillus thermoaerophilus TaxID=143495 RepID=UPI0011143E13|nr:hypothetical protein [Aneurinibacillus thermoaerophilus]